MQNKVRITIEGDSAAAINALGRHILTMLQGVHWSYEVRLPLVDGPAGSPQAYATRKLDVADAGCLVQVDSKVAVWDRPVAPPPTAPSPPIDLAPALVAMSDGKSEGGV